MKALIIILISLAATTHAAPKIEIKKHGVNFEKNKYACALDPYVTIQNRASTTKYDTRPLISMSVLLKLKNTGTLKVIKLYYNWEQTQWVEQAKSFNPEKESTMQPTCDYKKINNETLRAKEVNVTYSDLGFKDRPKVLATKSRIYIGGQLIEEHETKDRTCTWSDWENI